VGGGVATPRTTCPHKAQVLAAPWLQGWKRGRCPQGLINKDWKYLEVELKTQCPGRGLEPEGKPRGAKPWTLPWVLRGKDKSRRKLSQVLFSVTMVGLLLLAS
jgi:hypothetical protein